MVCLFCYFYLHPQKAICFRPIIRLIYLGNKCMWLVVFYYDNIGT